MKYTHRALKLLAAVTAGTTWVQFPKIIAEDSAMAASQNAAKSLDSFRYIADLGTPRRFATRYIKETRTIEMKIIPARAEEFDGSRYFDTKYIQRVVIKEQLGEVTMSFQLKDLSLGWSLVAIENPWRLVLDVFETDEEADSLDQQRGWSWNQNHNTVRRVPGVAGEKSINQVPQASVKPIQEVDVTSEAVPQVAIEQKSSTGDVTSERPRLFGRIEPVQSQPPEMISAIKDRITEGKNKSETLQAQKELASIFYVTGNHQKAVQQFRILASQDVSIIKADPKLLWQAGESAYLSKQDDAAEDYFNLILQFHPQSSYVDLAKLRKADLSLLQKQPQGVLTSDMQKWLSSYAEIARSEKDSVLAKIIAAMRVTHGSVDQDPQGAKPYHQILNKCVNQAMASFELLSECSYIQSMIDAQFSEITSAYEKATQYRESFKDEVRYAKLRSVLEQRMTQQITNAQKSNKLTDWIEIEKHLPAEALLFTLTNASLMFARAQAWDAVAEPLKAARLYGLFAQNASQEPQHTDALALASLGYFRSAQKRAAESSLKKLSDHIDDSEEKLSEKSLQAIRIMALSPYQSRTAFKIFEEQLIAGVTKETAFDALFSFAQMATSQKSSEFFCIQMANISSKSPEQIKNTESHIMRFAEKLAQGAGHLKAAEMYLLVAKINQGNHKAEAAYKAGLQFARAGAYEKAKESWQLAASDVTEKRYSALANERLERLK